MDATPVRVTASFAAALLLLTFSGLRGQDVELLGRIHGVRPPGAYHETLRRHPDAFRFSRAWKARVDGPSGGDGGGGPEGPEAWLQRSTAVRLASASGLGRRRAPVTGTFAYPVVLGLFADAAAPHDRAEVQAEFFDGPNSRGRTIPEFYEEISGGRVELVGETFGWERSRRNRSEVVGSGAGLGGDARVGEFIVELVSALDDGGVDWGAFDDDGPDGVPNSGDDDGYVDVLAVIHPTEGAECERDLSKIWSHRWHLSASGSVGRPYVTSSPAADGGSIRVDDYVIVPVLACPQDAETEDAINQIGVFAHELGHGFGLPDLYGTGASGHAGAGDWDLMGTGSWGCGGEGPDPARPCPPGAWTKHVLGWVDVDTVAAGAELRGFELEPVESGGRVLRVETNDGSGEYFLLEHRADPTLIEPGLFVWHVDPAVLDRTWRGNRVNADPDRPGVWLRQADGRDDLSREGGGRGDGGDPFPGRSGRESFHAGTRPSSFTHAGAASGTTLLGVSLAPGRVAFDLANRYRTVSLRTDGATADTSFFTVDGEAAGGREHAFSSAPFELHAVEAAPGDPVDEGVRRPFRGWDDGAPRVREFSTGLSDTTLVASYGGRELRFAVETTGGQDGVSPGTVAMAPGTGTGWVPEGATVLVEARPRTGFRFDGWSGDFEARPNPFEIDAVRPLTAGARFELTYSVGPNAPEVELAAAARREIVLRVENASEPVEWRVVRGELPPGLDLDPEGRIAGAPLEDGTFALRLRVRDAIGLRADLDLALVVRPLALPAAVLAAPFTGGERGPNERERRYLDRTGNGNGRFDVGDLRAHLRARAGPVPTRIAPDAAGADPTVIPPVELRDGSGDDGGPAGGGR